MPYRERTPAEIDALPWPLSTGDESKPRAVTRERFDAMAHDEREGLWFIEATGPGADRRVFPFFDDTGAFAYSGAPLMSRWALKQRGLTDEELEAERTRVFGPLKRGELKLDSDELDTAEMRQRRAAVFNSLEAGWYK